MATKTNLKCECGCGNDAQRSFLPGHDAKLKSRLLSQYRTGSAAQRKEAMTAATARGWAHFMSDAPVKTNGVKPKGRTTKATAPKPKAGFQPVRVKIGRWEYDATVLSEDVNSLTVRYHNNKGVSVVKEVKRSQIVD